MRTYIEDLEIHGFSVVPSVFDEATVKELRQIVLKNIDLMSNNRPTKTAFQLAGFHRFPSLEALHGKISNNSIVLSMLHRLYPETTPIALGLTDITINCSQPWHTDLLRGAYSDYLSTELCWGTQVQPCVKVLVYLQDGASLRVIPGSHKQQVGLDQVDLDDDRIVGPPSEERTHQVIINRGDIIFMDIRLVHRGPTEEEMEAKCLGDNARILVSSVFGARYSKLAQAMSFGNAKRTIDWDIINETGTKCLCN